MLWRLFHYSFSGSTAAVAAPDVVPVLRAVAVQFGISCYHREDDYDDGDFA